ncbi:unnamed protein product [Coregonus sp. 'balchen']|nr:unnamed protein product [Coregonus sp. 'balchen']
METRGIEQMFDFQRLPNDGLVLLLVLLYSPVGVCLMLLRIFVGAHVFLVSCALPDSVVRRFIVRVMSSVLGMHVRQNSPRLRDKSTKLYICNHVTQFDHNIVNLLTSCNTPMLEDSAGFVCWARGFMELGAISGQDEMEESLRRYCSSPGTLPLLIFPEEDTTNGRAGLLKFSSWPFSLTDSIQPVALQVKRPFLALLLATELGVVSTQITKADKAEHVKRKRHIAPRTTTSNLGARPRSLGFVVRSSGVEELRISRMAQQVKEVLPDIPLSIITRDLVQTNCVDTTITNLLESTEEFPLPAAKSFGKSPVDRRMSLQERKEALYEFARRRYIEKHGLEQDDNH